METFAYSIRLQRAREGGYSVTCRDLPEVVTQGEDLEDALNQAIDALDEAFAARIEDGEAFPKPSARRRGEHLIAPSADMSAKAALYLAMKETAMSKTDLARVLKVDEKEVRRLLDPRHPSKLPRMEDALRALGKRLVVSAISAFQPATAASSDAVNARIVEGRVPLTRLIHVLTQIRAEYAENMRNHRLRDTGQLTRFDAELRSLRHAAKSLQAVGPRASPRAKRAGGRIGRRRIPAVA